MVDISTTSLKREIERLKARISSISKVQSAGTAAVAEAPKRFRVFCTQTSALLTNVSVTVIWSTPMPTATYSVDANCAALATMPAFTVTNQTAAGCTVSFTSPSLLAVGTIVVVVGVAPAMS